MIDTIDTLNRIYRVKIRSELDTTRALKGGHATCLFYLEPTGFTAVGSNGADE